MSPGQGPVLVVVLELVAVLGLVLGLGLVHVLVLVPVLDSCRSGPHANQITASAANLTT